MLKRFSQLLLSLLLISCGGGGQDPIPTGIDATFAQGIWTTAQNTCMHFTASHGGAITFNYRRSMINVEIQNNIIRIIYDMYDNNDTDCAGDIVGQTVDIYEPNWVDAAHASVSGLRLGVQLNYLGRGESTVAVLDIPSKIKVLLLLQENQLYWYEGGDASEVDALGYPLGTGPVSGIYVRASE